MTFNLETLYNNEQNSIKLRANTTKKTLIIKMDQSHLRENYIYIYIGRENVIGERKEEENDEN